MEAAVVEVEAAALKQQPLLLPVILTSDNLGLLTGLDSSCAGLA